MRFFSKKPKAPALTNETGQEQPALPDEEREWDVVNGCYRTRPAAEAEKARLDAAREMWELPAPPATPNEDDQAA